MLILPKVKKDWEQLIENRKCCLQKLKVDSKKFIIVKWKVDHAKS